MKKFCAGYGLLLKKKTNCKPKTNGLSNLIKNRENWAKFFTVAMCRGTLFVIADKTHAVRF